jgi:hypothetical protein
MGVVALLALCGFGVILVGLAVAFGLGWTLAGGWIFVLGAALLLAAYAWTGLRRCAAPRAMRGASSARRAPATSRWRSPGALR